MSRTPVKKMSRSEHENPVGRLAGIATVVSCPPLKHYYDETGKFQAVKQALSDPKGRWNRWKLTRFLTESLKSSLIISGTGRAKSMCRS